MKLKVDAPINREYYVLNGWTKKQKRKKKPFDHAVIIVWIFLKWIVEWVGESFEDKFLTELDLFYVECR